MSKNSNVSQVFDICASKHKELKLTKGILIIAIGVLIFTLFYELSNVKLQEASSQCSTSQIEEVDSNLTAGVADILSK